MKECSFWLGVASIIGIIACITSMSSSDYKVYIDDGYKDFRYIPEDVLKMRKSSENARKIRDLMNDGYPDYMGGIYIDDNNDVIIQIVSKYVPEVGSYDFILYKDILGVTMDAKIMYVDYSMNELNDILNLILEKSIDINYINSVYVNVISNRVVVNLNDFSEEKIDEFITSIGDYPCLVFTNELNIVPYKL